MNNEINKRTHIEHKYLIHRFGGGGNTQNASISELFPLKKQTLSPDCSYPSLGWILSWHPFSEYSGKGTEPRRVRSKPWALRPTGPNKPYPREAGYGSVPIGIPRPCILCWWPLDMEHLHLSKRHLECSVFKFRSRSFYANLVFYLPPLFFFFNLRMAGP